MKEIMIFSEQGRVNHGLIVLLATLFPECDISIAAVNAQDFAPCPGGSFSRTDMADENGPNHAKYFSSGQTVAIEE